MFQLAQTTEILPKKSLLFDRLIMSSAVACVSYDLSLFWLSRNNSIFFIVGSLFHISSLMTQSLCLSHPRGILEYLVESFWSGEESRNLMAWTTLLLQYVKSSIFLCSLLFVLVSEKRNKDFFKIGSGGLWIFKRGCTDWTMEPMPTP